MTEKGGLKARNVSQKLSESDTAVSSSESEMDYYSESLVNISDMETSETSSSEEIVKCKKVKCKKKKKQRKETDSDSDTEGSSSTLKKKLKVKKKKIKKETQTETCKKRHKSPVKKSKVPVQKPKGGKMPVKANEVENLNLDIPEGDLDVNTLRTVKGCGRVSVAEDEWIKVMEFVQ